MRFRPQSHHFETPRASAVLARARFFAALWLLVSLAAHSLDACASHFGIPDAPAAALTVSADCGHENCVVCPQSQGNRADICNTVSETATRTAQSLQLSTPAVDSVSWAVVPQITATLKPPTNIVRSRDGPEDFSLPSSPTGTHSGRALLFRRSFSNT